MAGTGPAMTSLGWQISLFKEPVVVETRLHIPAAPSCPGYASRIASE